MKGDKADYLGERGGRPLGDVSERKKNGKVWDSI